MVRHLVFLRAINVGGRCVRMAELTAHLSGIGLRQVRTWIQSGNAVFEADEPWPEVLEQRIGQALEPLLGFRSEAFVRTLDELRAIVARSAASRAAVGAAGEVNVVFLPAALDGAQLAALQSLKSEVDDFVALRRELLWLCRTRQSDSKVSNAALERRLKLRCTIRRASMLADWLAHLDAEAR